jgi:predicted Zn-dependent protease
MAKGVELLPRAKALALRAVETDLKLARAHVALAITQLLHERNLVDAEKNLCRASALDPNDALPHRWHAKLLSSRGQHEEAIAAARRVLRADPLSLPVRRDLVEILFIARRYDETIAEAHQLIEMAGHAPDVQLGLAWVYSLKDDQAKAFHSLCAGFHALGTGPEILDRVAKAFRRGGIRAVFQLWARVMENQAALRAEDPGPARAVRIVRKKRPLFQIARGNRETIPPCHTMDTGFASIRQAAF